MRDEINQTEIDKPANPDLEHGQYETDRSLYLKYGLERDVKGLDNVTAKNILIMLTGIMVKGGTEPLQTLGNLVKVYKRPPTLMDKLKIWVSAKYIRHNKVDDTVKAKCILPRLCECQYCACVLLPRWMGSVGIKYRGGYT